jgi:hypothetical protein
MKRNAALFVLAVTMMITGLAQAEDVWVSPTGYTDIEGKWAEEYRSYDGSTNTYSRDISNREGWGPYLQLNFSTPVHSDRLRILSDYGWGVVETVELEVRYVGQTEWTPVHSGSVLDVTFTTITFTEGDVNAVRLRYNFLQAGYYWWLYEMQIYRIDTTNDPQGETLAATSVNATTATFQAHLTEDGGAPCQIRFQYGLDQNYGTDTAWAGEYTDGQSLGLPISGLTDATTYHYRAQFRNNENGTVVSGADFTFTTATPAATQAWISPTGVTDPDGKWVNLNNALDDQDGSFAQSYHPLYEPVYSSYLHFTVPATELNGFRLRGLSDGYIEAVDVDVYRNGAWADAYEGWFKPEKYEELSFDSGSVTEARVRFKMNTTGVGELWKLYEFYFHQGNLLSVSTLTASVTSPAWVEGVVWYPSDTVTVSVNGGAEVTASRFNRRGWYAPADGGNNRGVALSATAATNIIIKAMNGGSERASVTQSITWTPTDLTGKTTGNETLIRKNDNLLLTATGTGTTLTIDADGDGTTDYTGVPGDKYAYQYTTAGTYTAEAKIDDISVGTITVTAVEANLPAVTGCVMGVTRRKEVATIPASAGDNLVFIPYDDARVTVTKTEAIATGAAFEFIPDVVDTTHAVLRLGSNTGPILSETELQVSTVKFVTNTCTPVLKTYEDGDALSACTLELTPARDDLSLTLRIFSGGSAFEETGTNTYIVDTADFDANSQFNYYITSSTDGKLCHRIDLVQDAE